MTPRPALGWREAILRHFPPGSAADLPITVVWDPRGLLADPVIHETLSEAGFVTWTYEGGLRFRLAYETDIRAVADAGGTPPSLVLACRSEGLGSVPFDVLSRAQASRRELRFDVSELFPTVAPAALDDLEPVWFDALYEAVEREPQGKPRGLTSSREFLLYELFGLDTAKLDRPAVLLSNLAQLHLHRRELPESLAAHLSERLHVLYSETDWPIEDMVRDRSAFFALLQKQWPAFVTRLQSAQGREPGASYGTGREEPVPFEDPTLRTWVSALFLEGALEAVPWNGKPGHRPDEYRWGILEPTEIAAADRSKALAGELSEAIPSPESTYDDWLAFAPRWAQLSALALRAQDPSGELRTLLSTLWERMDVSFNSWMRHGYGALELVPKPIMLHRVLPLLRAQWTSGRKVALIVMDGMAWSQWIVLRDALSLRDSYAVSEYSVFAWVPTITPVSRQALFAAAPPREFAASIKTTQKDEAHWARFWMEHGLDNTSAQFLLPRHKETSESALTRLRHAAEHPMCRVLTMTVATIDEMSHGAVGGTPALLNQVDHWGRNGWMRTGIETLLENGFEVWITADHGNIECIGSGRPSEGALAEDRGARARTFSDPAVRRMIGEQYPRSLAWDSAGLPAGYLPLLSVGRSAFDTQGQTVISHGGIALEEVVVPLVRISA